ncbi:hypothetical protein [Paenisporosarcina antarctica]|nr:hypothetical protein [Paenisporosarcina antarctica]
MCNPKITNQNYMIEQTSLPYNNQDLIPSNHVSWLIDEMIESIDDRNVR